MIGTGAHPCRADGLPHACHSVDDATAPTTAVMDSVTIAFMEPVAKAATNPAANPAGTAPTTARRSAR